MRRDEVQAAIQDLRDIYNDPHIWTGGAPQEALNVLDELEEILGFGTLSNPRESSAIKGRRATSKQAALDAAPKAGSWRYKVLSVVRQQYPVPMTDHLIYGTLLRQHGERHPQASTIRARRVELVQGGWLKEADHKGLTGAGNPAIRWTLTDKALNHKGENQ